MRCLSHVDRNGRARMVNVSVKRTTHREATVQAVLHLSPQAFEALNAQTLTKGDALTVATIAGIQAAKRTAELIPLCHPLPLDHVDVTLACDASRHAILVRATTATDAKTGIEMEAFVAATVASLTLYDMVKAMDPAATITDVQLVHKRGGQHRFDRCAQPS